MEISIGVLQKVINEIIINPIPFLDIYAKDSISQCQDSFSITFFAALFITVRK